MSRARPIDRAAPPVLRAAISQVARRARPPVSPAATSSEWLRRLAGLPGRLRGAAGRARPDPLREGAFDLLVLALERAAVLLAMTARVVASTSSTPPATLVTVWVVSHLAAWRGCRVSRVDKR
ncbi:hypothetical protein MSEO_05900 [Mycobacterium seoulense]|uniref:Uncharacterized protein n=1 Tax=Mycobacterium seoulense TaxID=386911 RepID=A0A7I7NU63_9MYCO|nr:hypothetical protein MSEO_05900 [Mycobacterium seoulense]